MSLNIYAKDKISHHWKNSIKLKEAICQKTNMTDDEKQECIEHIDTLLFSRKE